MHGDNGWMPPPDSLISSGIHGSRYPQASACFFSKELSGTVSSPSCRPRHDRREGLFRPFKSRGSGMQPDISRLKSWPGPLCLSLWSPPALLRDRSKWEQDLEALGWCPSVLEEQIGDRKLRTHSPDVAPEPEQATALSTSPEAAGSRVLELWWKPSPLPSVTSPCRGQSRGPPDLPRWVCVCAGAVTSIV